MSVRILLKTGIAVNDDEFLTLAGPIRSIDVSRDLSVVVAGSEDGHVYVLKSTDS